MDKKTVFVKTAKGVGETNGQSDALYGDAKRILLLVDGASTVGDISKRAAPSLRETLNDMLQQLVDSGYIMDIRAPANVPQKQTLKIASPAYKIATPKAATHSTETQHQATVARPIVPSSDIQESKSAQEDQNGDLDFSFMTSPATQSEDAVGAVKAKEPETEKNASQEAEVARIKAEQSARIEAVASAVKLKAYEEAKEKAKIEVAARARIEAEARAKSEADAARLKAEQEALKTRRDLEATEARVEAEVRARIEAEAKVKQEAEAARLKAEKEAEIIRLELEAVKAKAVEEMRKRLEAEAQAKAEAEARLKREAEAERLKIEKERAELEVARLKAEAEKKMRAEAERRARAEEEERLKREAEAERLRVEKERAELEAARVKAELEVKVREEAERRVRAEVEERISREAEAERLRIEKELAELEVARVKAETELKMRAETELRVRAEVEARLKAEELAPHDDQISSSQEAAIGAGLNHTPSKEEQIDPAEKLKQSFVDSFGQARGTQKADSFNFKLDTFSLNGSAQKIGTVAYPKKTKTLPGGGSKVKAAIEKRVEKEAEAARIKVEQETARLKSEYEQAARIKPEQEEEREKAEAEAEAQKLSGQQAIQWEEAQQRAANQAQAEKERLARQSAETQTKPLQKPARVPRQQLPIGKMAASLFVLMLIAVAGLPYIWPLDQYIAPLEKEISAQLHQPVHIKKIHLALLPLLKLELHDLAMGSGQELKVGDAVLNFDFSALFARTKSINSIELTHVVLAGATLEKSLGWIQAAGANEKYPVTRMEFRGVQVTSDEIKLPLLNGRADFDTQGKFTHADLKSEDGKFGLELNSQQNRLQLELNIHESSLPVLTNIQFNDLSVNGMVGNGEIVFSDFFAHIHGGTITGKGQLNWSNGWKLQGQLNAKSLELESMFPKFGVTGELYGDVNVSMSGSALSQLDKDPRMEGAFEAKNGVVNKLDIDTIARFGALQGGTGRTNFSELIGTLKADQRGQRFNLSKIAAGAASGSGFFEVDAKQQLSGKLLVDIKGDAKGNVPLQLSGSLPAPLLQQGH